jgi:hypothetical protein
LDELWRDFNRKLSGIFGGSTKPSEGGGSNGGGGMPVARPIAGGAPQNPNAVKSDLRLPSAAAAKKRAQSERRPGANVITGDPMRADYFA